MPITAKITKNEDGTITVRERRQIPDPDYPGKMADMGFHTTTIDVDDTSYVQRMKHGDAGVEAEVAAAVAAFHTPQWAAQRRAVHAAQAALDAPPA